MTITQKAIANCGRLNNGYLDIDLKDVIKRCLSPIAVEFIPPGQYGQREVNLDKLKRTISLPNGKTSFTRYTCTARTGLIGFESGKCKFNYSPLLLIRSISVVRGGNYDYSRDRYYLLGRNEAINGKSGEHFLHQIKPEIGELAISKNSLEPVRNWMWSISKDESLAYRQGDLGIIVKNRIPNFKDPQVYLTSSISIKGSHKLHADRIVISNTGKIFGENIHLTHREHNTVAESGIFEIRVAKSWNSNGGD